MTYIPQQLRITPIEGWERPKSDEGGRPKEYTLEESKELSRKRDWYMWDSKLNQEHRFDFTFQIFEFFKINKISSISKFEVNTDPYRKRYFFSKGSFTESKKEECKRRLIDQKKQIGKESQYRVYVRDIWGKVTLYETASLAGEAMGGDKTAVYRIINHKKRNLDGFSAMREGDLIFPAVEYYKITKDGQEFRHCTMLRACQSILKKKGKDLRSETIIRWFNEEGYVVEKCVIS